ncbi:acyltransferase family protein [Virgibacillus halodenitrificans]|nr:acyltransferase family protein [Virgibacillus halodenitrificans]
MDSKRFYELDALRGIAALIVVLFHYSTKYNELYGHSKTEYITTFEWGHYGVQLFFIISGFVIYMTVLKVSSVKDFIFKRAIRLYPAYVFAVILTFVISSIYILERMKVSVFEAIVNLTMLQGFIPNMPTVDGVYWSLRVELTFYIIMAVLLMFKLERRTMLFSIVWLLTSCFIQIAYHLNDSHLFLLLESFSISKYSHLFIIGIMFFLLKEKNRLSCHLVILSCIIYDFIFQGIESGLFTTCCVMIFYLIVSGKLKFLNNKPLVFLGSISYALYLVHQNIGYVIINFMESIGLENEFFIVIPITISILLAWILTKFVEKPIQFWLGGMYKRRKDFLRTEKEKYKVL